ncbi:hypothetical protein JP09_009995 [Dehalogenimonas etheniformans]|uniref:Uncharacterized protein n=1 Tax=Dehalogenimonas etheniformans TaxID=1536648 RepID=A0A2P5P4Y4_9CHLR|nr:hypothetical protein JP09_009995 [Dehalogenimonas etheniformans]
MDAKAYSLMGVNGTLHIIDDENSTDWPGKRVDRLYSKQLRPDDYNRLLVSTIDVIDGTVAWNWEDFTTTSPSWTESFKGAIPLKRVVKWLEEWGLPGHSGDAYTHGLWGYPLQKFKISIATIYLLFEINDLLREIEISKTDIESTDRLKHLTWLLITHPFFLKPLTADQFRTKYLEKENMNMLEAIRQNVGMCLDQQLSGISLHYTFLGPKFYLSVKSLFDVCHYQLGLLTTLSLEEYQAKKRHIKTCKACGSLHWGHGNQRYCSRCDRRTVWSRERAKKQATGGNQ